MKPLFIVFEGLDGSGTSTQVRLLENALQAKGLKVMPTSEPSPGPVGNMIRQAFKGRLKFSDETGLFDRQMAYLFAADRFDHLHNEFDGVLKKVDEGYFVLSTRYYFSSFAYHCKNDEDWAVVERLNKDFPAPDLLVYLKNPVEESLRRLSERPSLDSYETKEKLQIVAENYRRIIDGYTGEKIVIDATHPPAEIHAEIFEKLRGLSGE
jgi:dTMP kinase